MAKVFFALCLAGLAAVLWMTLPRGIHKTCPVCLGRGSLPLPKPAYVAREGEWREKKDMLCPFCRAGRISLHELKERRTQMLRWMVKEQKLAEGELARRVEAAWGKAGLEELRDRNFFVQGPSSR